MTPSRRPPPLKLDSISELPEHLDLRKSVRMNLGVESPTSVVRPSMTPTSPGSHVFDDWGKCGFVVNSNFPTRRRSWRSLSWSAGKHQGIGRFEKDIVDNDCAICFEPAINPRRTSCCAQIFCYAHLADWLKSNKNCPSCDSRCISPLSPTAPAAHLKDRPTTTPTTISSSSSSGRSSSTSPSSISPEPPPSCTQSLSYLTRLVPAISAVSSAASQEIGKLLTLIAFILVLCVIASP